MIETYGLTPITPPLSEPVTLQEAKDWLRLEHAVDDVKIQGLILTARSLAERNYDRSLISQVWQMTLPWFCSWEIRLPRGPLRSVESIKYTDTQGILQTLAPSSYLADTTNDPGIVYPSFASNWPATRYQPGAVQITYQAGYGDAPAVPEPIKSAIKVAVAWWYEHAGEEVESVKDALPVAVDMLLSAYWAGSYA